MENFGSIKKSPQPTYPPKNDEPLNLKAFFIFHETCSFVLQRQIGE